MQYGLGTQSTLMGWRTQVDMPWLRDMMWLGDMEDTLAGRGWDTRSHDMAWGSGDTPTGWGTRECEAWGHGAC